MLDRTRGDLRGPLHGVPMTVKESFDVAGLPTTWGYADAPSKSPTSDALAVHRLEAAGAVVFGKTNVPVSLADWQSYNPVYGATNNPWNAGAHAGRLLGRRRGGAGGGAERAGNRQRHRRLDPRAGALLRHVRPQADLGPVARRAAIRWSGAAAMTDISVIGPLARSAEDLAVALDAARRPRSGRDAADLPAAAAARRSV